MAPSVQLCRFMRHVVDRSRTANSPLRGSMFRPRPNWNQWRIFWKKLPPNEANGRRCFWYQCTVTWFWPVLKVYRIPISLTLASVYSNVLLSVTLSSVPPSGKYSSGAPTVQLPGSHHVLMGTKKKPITHKINTPSQGLLVLAFSFWQKLSVPPTCYFLWFLLNVYRIKCLPQRRGSPVHSPLRVHCILTLPEQGTWSTTHAYVSASPTLKVAFSVFRIAFSGSPGSVHCGSG